VTGIIGCKQESVLPCATVSITTFANTITGKMEKLDIYINYYCTGRAKKDAFVMGNKLIISDDVVRNHKFGQKVVAL